MGANLLRYQRIYRANIAVIMPRPVYYINLANIEVAVPMK